MSFQITTKSNIARVIQAIGGGLDRQVAFATSVALNRTARDAKAALIEEMKRVFDRPNPFTLNSLWIRNSTKTTLVARVEHREFAGKGVPASKYLRPQVSGGDRRMKRSEVAVARKLGLPQVYLIPSDYTPRDQYGNVPGSFIVRMLSNLQAFGEQGYRANMSAVSRTRQQKRGTYMDFVPILAGNSRGLSPGIYERIGQGEMKRLRPIFFIRTTPPTYRARYDMENVVNKTVDRLYEPHFKRAMEEAIKTAR